MKMEDFPEMSEWDDKRKPADVFETKVTVRPAYVPTRPWWAYGPRLWRPWTWWRLALTAPRRWWWARVFENWEGIQAVIESHLGADGAITPSLEEFEEATAEAVAAFEDFKDDRMEMVVPPDMYHAALEEHRDETEELTEDIEEDFADVIAERLRSYQVAPSNPWDSEINEFIDDFVAELKKGS